jgi:hypothetical protein
MPVIQEKPSEEALAREPQSDPLAARVKSGMANSLLTHAAQFLLASPDSYRVTASRLPS